MCSGNFQCDYGGVSRVPHDSLLEKIASKSTLGISKDDLMKNNIVRIPDVYKLKITLQSLLPNSFNNYLLRYTGNMDMQDGTLYNQIEYLGKKF